MKREFLFCWLFLLCLSVPSSCASTTPRTIDSPADSDTHVTSSVDSARLAKDVTIYRDRYGIPHVHGRTDEAAIFGLAYARAEDQFELIEEIFIGKLGRSSELYGEEGLFPPQSIGKGHDLSVYAFGYLDGEVDVHIMSGNGQQRVMVVPELSLAVTMFAGHYDDPSPAIGWMPDRLLVEYIIDAVIPVTKGGE